jgi:plasmid stabilization system protein ParE
MNPYVFHADAYADLNDAWEFIAAENIDAADRVMQEIYDAISSLVPFPQQGHKRPDLTRRPLRFRRVRDYLIAYAPDEKPLLVGRPDSRSPKSQSDGCYSSRTRLNNAPHVTCTVGSR